jgi:purine-binding chemotaxis protein CheW
MIDNVSPAAEVRLVVFRLGEDYFAMTIQDVNEIIRLQKITPVPKAPPFVVGVTSLRGRVIPVIDLRTRFGLAPREEGHLSRIVVTEHDGKLIGMIVDGVDEVLIVPAEAIEPPDEIVVSVDSEFLAGIVRLEDRLIILLDQEQVLTATEFRQLQGMKVGVKALKEAEAQAQLEGQEALVALPSGSGG